MNTELNIDAIKDMQNVFLRPITSDIIPEGNSNTITMKEYIAMKIDKLPNEIPFSISNKLNIGISSPDKYEFNKNIKEYRFSRIKLFPFIISF
jgi:hypothetical protein